MRILTAAKGVADKLVDAFMTFMFSLVFLVVLLQIFCRYVLGSPLVWSEELSRFIFIWVSLVGWTQAVRSGTHIRITFFEERLPEPIRKALHFLFHLGSILFLCTLTWLGCLLSRRTFGRSLVTLTDIPVGLLYASLPVSAGLCLFYSVYNLLHPIREDPAVME